MIAYPRRQLAEQLVQALQGKALLGDAHNGLFLAAPRRTGKSTFLQGDLSPALEAAGVNFRLKLPHQAFHRQIGEFSPIQADPDGNVMSDADWEQKKGDYLPSDADRVYIESLMQPVIEPGKFANWIAPPKVGIDNKPGDFEYVKLA